MHNGAQPVLSLLIKTKIAQHETNNTKAPTSHRILKEGLFILDSNYKVWDSGGPQVPTGHSYIPLK